MNEIFDTRNWINEQITVIDNFLSELIKHKEPHPEILFESMNYSVFSGGKRLRPILTLAACNAWHGNLSQAMPIACAIELVHAYSLIHDDLPAMDNDDYRRGKLTNHKVYGDAVAILAGDALLTEAFAIAASSVNYNLSAKTTVQLISELAKAAGSMGMVGGQVADMTAEDKNLTEVELRYIHEHKTGALFAFSIRAGAIVSGVTDNDLSNLTNFANKIGLAYQIQDDILDIIGDEKLLGKKVGSDIENNKSTYPSIVGLEEAKKMVTNLTDEALEQLTSSNCPKPQILYDISKMLINRKA